MTRTPAELSLHLTEDEIDDLLLGEGDTHTRSHAQTCPACAQRLQAFTAVVGDFNQASLAWATAKSNTISRDLSEAAATRYWTLPAWTLPTWTLSRGWAGSLTTAVLIAAVAAGVYAHRQTSVPLDSAAALAKAAAPATPGANVPREEIASDNEMLRAIDSAINSPVPSPEQLYSVSAAGVSKRRPGPQVVN